MTVGVGLPEPSSITDMKRHIPLLLVLLFVFSEGHAQEDPGLAAQIFAWTNKATLELKAQETAMTLETAGQVRMEEEWRETADIQRLYNEYLDSFRHIVVFAAQAYGFYQEVDKLAVNFQMLGRVIDDHPSGVFAGALSARRNEIYREVLMNAIDIINDVRVICISGSKMTEKERMATVFGIRPKLHLMNQQIRRLIRVVKYSSFTDILVEIELIERKGADKGAITRACLARWKRNCSTN